MSRIHIIGGSGSGKTRLSAALAERLGLPVWHLDDLAADPATGRHRPAREWREAADGIARGDAWITEGIQVEGIEGLLESADRIIWLDNVGARAASRRVLTRFVTDAAREARTRQGLQRVVRVRDYSRQLRQLAGALGETRAYHAKPAAGNGSSRRATQRLLAPHGARVIRCGTDGEVEEVLKAAARSAAAGARRGAA